MLPRNDASLNFSNFISGHIAHESYTILKIDFFKKYTYLSKNLNIKMNNKINLRHLKLIDVN